MVLHEPGRAPATLAPVLARRSADGREGLRELVEAAGGRPRVFTVRGRAHDDGRIADVLDEQSRVPVLGGGRPVGEVRPYAPTLAGIGA